MEDWETLHLHRNYPSHVANVYDRPGYFQVRLVSFNDLSGGGVLVLNQDRMRRFLIVSRVKATSVILSKGAINIYQRHLDTVISILHHDMMT